MAQVGPPDLEEGIEGLLPIASDGNMAERGIDGPDRLMKVPGQRSILVPSRIVTGGKTLDDARRVAQGRLPAAASKVSPSALAVNPDLSARQLGWATSPERRGLRKRPR